MTTTSHSLRLLLACAAAWTLTACGEYKARFYDGPGKRPVYVTPAELRDIRNEDPQPIRASGTLFLQDTLLFLLEQGRGIHVFGFRDSVQTNNLAFFKIPAVTDFVIAGNTLYADSWRDLVVIDIGDLNHIKEVNRIPGAINPALFPPLYDGYFECVDETRGAVVGWEDAELERAACQTTN